MNAQLHPNDSESFSGGLGEPSDPTPMCPVVDGGQRRDVEADTVIAQAVAILAIVALVFTAAGIALWLHESAAAL